MFASETPARSVIFIETVIDLKWKKHTAIEAIPVPEEDWEEAPLYFRNALLTSGSEWSQHPKLLSTTSRGLRNTLVKELPYFHVWFTPDGGIGQVVEDGREWKLWFGREVVAGMLQVGPELYRNQRRCSEREVRERVDAFKGKWEAWDWTKLL